MRKILFAISILIFGIGSATAQEKVSKKEARKIKKEAVYQNSTDLIESGTYNLEVTSISTRRGLIHPSAGDNIFKVSDGTLEMDLQFFGRAYSSDYGTTSGIQFKGEVADYSVEKKDSKRAIMVKMTAKGTGDNFRIMFTITGNSGSLVVTSDKRESITYSVTLESPECECEESCEDGCKGQCKKSCEGSCEGSCKESCKDKKSKKDCKKCKTDR